ncbi:esterase/lipase family protein [Turneriella parva]|uniref:Alpha/beta hydrolase fold containing protein n=1 Tax=Turneriella parva (strain ATCC BAA-1111 / DSM 21527 / NCTC 11395 / H) TaxID=869212 RepID=I4B0X4_TURPD|nr:alpha/beta fold hydrolase [Turneriella parva]AFM10931.1 alpha/beta hydrolase fold containing protein [Turneriella parva DSM 21527]
MLKRSAEQNLRYPVLLVHGLFSSSRTWHKTVTAFVEDYDLRYGGTVSAQPSAKIPPPTAGDFYTWNFSSNHHLTYRQQAEELAAGIEAICALNAADKVVLIGHSMGGLAARALVQLYSADRVYALITIGTPHYGSPLALLRESTQREARNLFTKLTQVLARADAPGEANPGFFRRLARRLFRVTTEAQQELDGFFSSEAFIELAPGSIALEELNRAPLPTAIRYVFITGSLTDFAAFPDPVWIARYRKLNSMWKRLAANTVQKISNRYLFGPYEEFRSYLARYLPDATEYTLAHLTDFDGAVPVLSQIIGHFRDPPLLKAVLPVYASHTRLTKRPAKIFQALAVCGAVGASQRT